MINEKAVEAGLQQRVYIWFKRAGGWATNDAAISRMLSEVSELSQANLEGSWDDVREECADVLICLMLIAANAQFDLLEAAEEKLAINQQRKWTVSRKLGTLKHVKGSDPRHARTQQGVPDEGEPK